MEPKTNRCNQQNIVGDLREKPLQTRYINKKKNKKLLQHPICWKEIRKSKNFYLSLVFCAITWYCRISTFSVKRIISEYDDNARDWNWKGIESHAENVCVKLARGEREAARITTSGGKRLETNEFDCRFATAASLNQNFQLFYLISSSHKKFIDCVGF